MKILLARFQHLQIRSRGNLPPHHDSSPSPSAFEHGLDVQAEPGLQQECGLPPSGRTVEEPPNPDAPAQDQFIRRCEGRLPESHHEHVFRDEETVDFRQSIEDLAGTIPSLVKNILHTDVVEFYNVRSGG